MRSTVRKAVLIVAGLATALLGGCAYPQTRMVPASIPPRMTRHPTAIAPPAFTAGPSYVLTYIPDIAPYQYHD